MKRVSMRYGTTEITREVPEGTTCGQLAQDSSIKALLGCGDNVRFLLNGIEMPAQAMAPDADEGQLVFETRANTKAQG